MNFTPGISIETKKIKDQNYKNIFTIKKEDLPDIIIIGRGIYNSPNILEIVKSINQNINLKLKI